MVMMLFVGAARSGITLVRDIVLSEAIGEDEVHTHRRHEGSYLDVNAFIERLVLLFIGGSNGLVLGVSGYNATLAEQPASVSMGVYIDSQILLFVLLLFLFLFLL
jgi:Na+/melibiose symporter-like transporter